MAAPLLAAVADEGQGAQELQQATSTRVFYLGPVKLEVECVEAFRGTLLGSGVDATGVMMWPGSFILARYLLEHASLPSLSSPRGHHPTHIVELGAGATGLAGLLAARLLPLEARVTLTDRDAPSLALLRANAARVERSEMGRVAARALSWGDEEQAAEIVRERGPSTLCIGADILYPAIEVDTIRQLLRSARRLLGGSEGRVLLSFIDRDQGGSLHNLLTALRDEAFLLERAWELDHDANKDDEALRLEEEEAAEEDEEQQPKRWRRRPVVLMRGAKLLLLAPMVPGDESLQEKQAAAEARWLPGVWDAPCREGSKEGEESDEEEWAPPPLSSSSDEEG